MPFGSRSSWSGLCCAVCCRSLVYVGAYLGWARCGGKVRLCRLPEVIHGSAAIQAYDDDTGLHQSWEKTDYCEVPEIVADGKTWRCVSVAGSQCSDGGWIEATRPNYAWYQLHFAPTDDLGTTSPRAGLARVRVHDASYSAVVGDRANREWTLLETWLANDENGDPYYWNGPNKLCQYHSDGAPKTEVCVGSNHFAIVTRRLGAGQETNRVIYWDVDTSTATLTEWDNPEVGGDSGAYFMMAAFDRHAFPWGCGIRTVESGSITKTTQHGPANLGAMRIDTTYDAAKPGTGDTYNMRAEWSTIGPPEAPTLTAEDTALWLQEYFAFGAYVSPEEADIVPFYSTDDDPTRYLFQGMGIWQLSAKTINSNQHNCTSNYEGAEGEEIADRIQFMSAGYDQGAGYNHIFTHPQATITGSDAYSSISGSANSKRIWGFPGNHRCGWQRNYWNYADEDSNQGGLGAFITLITAGSVYWPFDTLEDNYDSDRLLVYSLIADDFGTGPYYWAIDANNEALGVPGDVQVFTSAYGHRGETSGVGKEIERTKYLIHGWPLSLCSQPYTINEITYEPDAIDMGQAVSPFYEALDLQEWNDLAHPHLEIGTALTETRWCYYWVGIADKLYPMVKIRADGRWEPRRPPRGEYYDSEGVLHQAYSLGWDNSPDVKHPNGDDWPFPEVVIEDL